MRKDTSLKATWTASLWLARDGRRQRLRRLAVAWGRWATRNIMAFADAWRLATTEMAPSPDEWPDFDLSDAAPVIPDPWVDECGDEGSDDDEL